MAETRRFWATGLKLAVSAGVLAALFSFLPWAELAGGFRRVSGWIWLTVLAGFLVGHVVGALKWWTMLSAMGVRFSFIDSVRCYAAGLFANLCLPGIVGGDVIRAGLAARRAGRTEAVVLGSLADRSVDIAALASVMGVGAVLAGSRVGDDALRFGLWVLALGLVGGGLTVAGLYFMPQRPWLGRFRRPLNRSRVALRRLARRPGVAAICFALAFGIQGGFALLNGWIGISIGVAVPLAAWLVVWPLAKLAGLLPVSLGGLGVRDATLGALLAAFGARVSEGVVTSLVWQSVLIAGGLLAGLFWWIWSRRDSSDAGRIGEWIGRES